MILGRGGFEEEEDWLREGEAGSTTRVPVQVRASASRTRCGCRSSLGLFGWLAIGLVIYFQYSREHSVLAVLRAKASP